MSQLDCSPVVPNVVVSKRAVVERVNRQLLLKNEKLRTTRGTALRANLGDYYLVDLGGYLIDAHVDLEQLGRTLGVLRLEEVLAS